MAQVWSYGQATYDKTIKKYVLSVKIVCDDYDDVLEALAKIAEAIYSDNIPDDDLNNWRKEE